VLGTYCGKKNLYPLLCPFRLCLLQYCSTFLRSLTQWFAAIRHAIAAANASSLFALIGVVYHAAVETEHKNVNYVIRLSCRAYIKCSMHSLNETYETVSLISTFHLCCHFHQWIIIIIIIINIKGIYIAQIRKGHKCAMSVEMAVWLRNCLYLYSYLHN